MLRLLVIEDSEHRIDTFRQWLPPDLRVVYATSAGRALRILDLDSGAVYAGILLDHDLDQQVAVDGEERFTGLDVARRIVDRVHPDVPVLVHSVNSHGAAAIRGLLETAGFSVTRVRFDQLTQTRLLDWLAEVRAEHEFRAGQ